MEIGMVDSYDGTTSSGVAVTTDGEKLELLYEDGQNWVFNQGTSTPTLSGKHGQPEGFSLKHPDTGDPVAFIREGNGSIEAWGYLHHYVGLAERRHPTRFVFRRS